MSFFDKIKKVFRHLPKRKHKKSKEHSTITNPSKQRNAGSGYKVTHPRSSEEDGAHRKSAQDTTGQRNYRQSPPLPEFKPLDVDVITSSGRGGHIEALVSFEDVGVRFVGSRGLDGDETGIGGIPDNEEGESDCRDEDDALMTSWGLSMSVGRSPLEKSMYDVLDGNTNDAEMDRRFGADDSAILIEAEKDEIGNVSEMEGFLGTSQKYSSPHALAHQAESKRTTPASYQNDLSTSADVLTTDPSPKIGPSTLDRPNSIDSIEASTALEETSPTLENDKPTDLSFDIEGVIFTDVNAMARHFSKAERSKRVTINPFKLEYVGGAGSDDGDLLGVGDGDVELDDARELSEREIGEVGL